MPSNEHISNIIDILFNRYGDTINILTENTNTYNDPEDYDDIRRL